MLKLIDKFLNQITMYRLMLYGLLIQTVLALFLSAIGIISFPFLQMSISMIVLVIFSEGFNILFAKMFHAVRNTESAIITAFLLFFVLDPTYAVVQTFWVLPLAAGIAMLSKYVLAIKRRHLFNPVAITAVIMSLVGLNAAIWWVATPALFPFVLIFGLLIIHKLRRAHLVFPFFAAALLIALFRGLDPISFFVSWPIIFFGTTMVTEPRTAPSKKRDQILYGILIGALFALPYSIGSFALTPEFSLVIANLLAYLVSSKQVYKLRYKKTIHCTPQVCDLVFCPDQKLNFIAGQFLEWTIPLAHADSRGNRRFFSVASSPTDLDVHLGVRLDHEHGSAFKKELTQLKEGDALFASHAAGDFVLPKDETKKLVFIAGGIGITPFWSMLQWLKDVKQKRDIVLFYAANSENDFAYQSELDAYALETGMKIIYVVAKPFATWTGRSGYLTQALIEETVLDYKSRLFYLSGPNAMVENYNNLLRSMNIKGSNIKKDFFPGF